MSAYSNHDEKDMFAYDPNSWGDIQIAFDEENARNARNAERNPPVFNPPRLGYQQHHKNQKQHNKHHLQHPITNKARSKGAKDPKDLVKETRYKSPSTKNKVVVPSPIIRPSLITPKSWADIAKN